MSGTRICKNEWNENMYVNGAHQIGCQHSSKYLLLSSAEERNSYTIGTTQA